tara:strand:- start:2547 stop:2816 length:270 start_codon:yes stop_codon:yes gene_type:complete
MTRKRYKPAYYDTEEESLTRATKETTWASVMDAWREFYNTGLINDDERKMVKKLLSKKLCNPCDSNKTDQEELERMNDLARALKGNLNK